MNVIYLRTSTDEQNPENQLADIQSIAPKDAEILQERQSAWKDHIKARPVFENLRSRIRAGKISHLYVWDLDRLYRNRLRGAAFLKMCKAYNCRVHSFRQSWLEEINKIPAPWNEIVNDLMVNILGWIAEDESNRKSERIKAAIRRKAKGTYSYKGKKWGRKGLPKQTIDRVLDLHSQGKSIREIASVVTVWDKNRNGKLISKSAVHKIISENRRR